MIIVNKITKRCNFYCKHALFNTKNRATKNGNTYESHNFLQMNVRNSNYVNIICR